MAYLEHVFAHLLTFSLPVWLAVEHVMAERRRFHIASAVRAERLRVDESRRALARKAGALRRAS